MRTAITRFISRITMVLMGIFASVYAFAQEEGAKLDIDVTKTTETTSTNWYANPWIWIVGAAVFILLFAAIIRGGRRSDA